VVTSITRASPLDGVKLTGSKVDSRPPDFSRARRVHGIVQHLQHAPDQIPPDLGRSSAPELLATFGGDPAPYASDNLARTWNAVSYAWALTR
jgi:hypothetical protein